MSGTRIPSNDSQSAIRLTSDEQTWLRKKWSNIRESQQRADRSSREWNRLNEGVNEYLDKSGVTDVVQRDKIKGQNLTMKGALATHAWHAAESQRHIEDVNLFLRMKELGVL